MNSLLYVWEELGFSSKFAGKQNLNSKVKAVLVESVRKIDTLYGPMTILTGCAAREREGRDLSVTIMCTCSSKMTIA